MNSRSTKVYSDARPIADGSFPANMRVPALTQPRLPICNAPSCLLMAFPFQKSYSKIALKILPPGQPQTNPHKALVICWLKPHIDLILPGLVWPYVCFQVIRRPGRKNRRGPQRSRKTRGTAAFRWRRDDKRANGTAIPNRSIAQQAAQAACRAFGERRRMQLAPGI
jgi:hypothetical protein